MSGARGGPRIAVAVLLAIGVGCNVGCNDRAKPASPPLAAAVPAPAPAPRVERPKQFLPVTTSSPAAREAFLEARKLVEHNREAEAVEGFKRAVKLDPKFALALAYRGYYGSGGEGLADLERALELGEQLPEAEQLYISLLHAYRHGDAPRAAEVVKRLLQLAPDEWRASFELGQQAYDRRDFNLAIDAYRRSMELADLTDTCIGFNNLGYAQAMVERFELSLLALQRCADLAPKEPNPQDSLGEVALAAGKLEDADASFRQALVFDPQFSVAWEGIAAVRFFRGDRPGFADALAKAKATSLVQEDRAAEDVLAAWMFFAADGEPARALKQLEVMEREARALKTAGLYDLADAGIHRSAILLEAGKAGDALAAANVAIQRANTRALPGALSQAALRRARMRRLLALVKLNQLPEANAVLADLEEAGKPLADNAEVRSGLHFARGMILAAERDLPGAKAELSQCVLFGLSEWTHDHRMHPEDGLCLLNLAEVQQKLGERAAAEQTLEKLRRKYTRDPVAVYVWSRARR